MPLNNVSKRYLRARLEEMMERAPEVISMSAIILVHPDGDEARGKSDATFTVGAPEMHYLILETLVDMVADIMTANVAVEDTRGTRQ